MVQGRLFAHDRNQLELRVGYTADGGARDRRYRVEAFLFFPRNLGITPDVYGREVFYRDTAAFVRFSTPVVPLTELSAGGGAAVYRGLREAQATDPALAVQRIKVLACVLKSAMKREASEARSADALEALARDVEGALTRLHSHSEPDSALPAQVASAWAACEEFISLEAEAVCTRVVERTEGELRERFATLAVQCYEHRRARGLESFVEPGEENEAVLLHHRRAKRAMYSVLYLEAQRHESGRLWNNVAGMVSAAVAMLFAVLSTIWASRHFEMASITFVGIAVLSYVVKDRIKDLGRALVGRRLAAWVPDHEVVVRDHGHRQVGTLRETVRITEPAGIDPAILAERMRHHDSALASDARPETVVCWRKELRLDGAALARHPLAVHGLTDIMRFNFERLRDRMDAPYQDRVVVDPESHALRSVRCASVHHVNVLVRLRSDGGPDWAADRVEAVRVVLDERGIKRVEDLG